MSSVFEQRLRSNPNDKIVVHAGELVFGKGKKPIFTLLGSCIAITLWHPRHRFAGLCHFALPDKPPEAPNKLDARYARDCLKLFEKAAADRGTQLKEYRANIFGGGNMLHKHATAAGLSGIEAEWEKQPIGEKNAAVAFELLLDVNCKILKVDVGEFGYRKVYFDPYTGETYVEYNAVTK